MSNARAGDAAGQPVAGQRERERVGLATAQARAEVAVRERPQPRRAHRPNVGTRVPPPRSADRKLGAARAMLARSTCARRPPQSPLLRASPPTTVLRSAR